MTEDAFIKECRADRERYRETLRMIQTGQLKQSQQGNDGRIVDTTPDYAVHVKRLIAELDILIGDSNA